MKRRAPGPVNTVLEVTPLTRGDLERAAARRATPHSFLCRCASCVAEIDGVRDGADTPPKPGAKP